MTKIKWSDIFYYDETSPSGLRWLINSGKKFCGDVAGSKSWSDKEKTKPKCWDVRYNKKLYKAHRIIYEMLNEMNIDNKLVINHIDTNPFNNKIENLELISQDKNIRKCKSHLGISLQSNNSTGVNGVSVVKKDAKVVSYVSSHRDYPDGKNVVFHFSTSRYGEELAFLLASTCREFFIKKCNEKGADYAVFHK